MPETRRALNHPEASLYTRHAARITNRKVLHELEKEALIAAVPRLKRKRAREEMEAAWLAEERTAQAEARDIVAAVRAPVQDVADALETLAAVRQPELLGKVEIEQLRLRNALGFLD